MSEPTRVATNVGSWKNSDAPPRPSANSRSRLPAALTVGPGLAWLAFFLFIPLVAVGVMSFVTRGEYGQIEWTFTLENYKRFFGFGLFGFDPLYPQIILRSLAMGMAAAGLCLLAGLPLAFFIARLPGRWKNVALTLVVIPFWTNLLIRTYAWQILLSPESALSQLAAALGFIEPGTALHPSLFAVYVGMVCDFLPFMALPLYASVEKIDWSLAEAAMDLGADRLRTFWHAVLPQIAPGLIAGFILVAIPAMGQFVIPDLLGGAKTAMLGNVIAQQFGQSRDWPFGSAIAFLSMGVVLVALWVHARTVAAKAQELPV